MITTQELTDRQARFCEEYLIDLNATQAAIRAGYSEKTANEQGARLLANVSVQEKIAELKAERAKRTEMTQDSVIQELAAVARAEVKGVRAAVVYGSEGNIADCFDNAVALVADGETAVYYGGTPDVFENAAAQRALKELQRKRQAENNGGVNK